MSQKMRVKSIAASSISPSAWQCPACARKDVEVEGSLHREIREIVREGKLTGENTLGNELYMEVEAIHCPVCQVTWVIEPTDVTQLRIENVELKHELAAMRGESYTAWF